MLAGGVTIHFFTLVQQLKRPVLFLSAVGFSFFVVTGAEKALYYGHNGEVAVLLGITTAVGGGVIRDILLNRVPIILEKEIYASAALIAALIIVLGKYLDWISSDLVAILALLVCFSLRILALHYHWNLPTPGNKNRGKNKV